MNKLVLELFRSRRKLGNCFSPLEHYNILGYTLNDLRGIHLN